MKMEAITWTDQDDRELAEIRDWLDAADEAEPNIFHMDAATRAEYVKKSAAFIQGVWARRASAKSPRQPV